jgi:hypothetical protein
MTDQELILHLTRKNAQLEKDVVYYKEEYNKYSKWWLDVCKELKELKSNLSNPELKEVQNVGE